MTSSQIDNRLQKVLTGMGIHKSALTRQAHFSRDLGLDSLDIADLIIQTEDRFGVRIPNEYWDQLETVGQLTDFLTQELKMEQHPWQTL